MVQVDDQSPHFETEQVLVTANAETDEQKRRRIEAQDALVREWIAERRRRGDTAVRPRNARPATAADLAAVGIKLVHVPRRPRPAPASAAPASRVACSTPRPAPAARSSLGRRTSSGQRRTASASSAGGGSSGEPGEPSADPPRHREGGQQVGRGRR